MSTDEPAADDKSPDSTPTAEAGESSEEEQDSPWAILVFGVILMIGGVWVYWYFGNLEAEGGEVRMPAVVWLVYDFLGRTGLLMILELLGALMVWAGVSDLRKQSAESD